MGDWLSDNGWVLWTALAGVLGVAELLSLDLVLGMLAVGALAGVLADVVGLGLLLQAVVAVVASVALLGLARPRLVARLHGGPDLVTGHAKLVGHTAVVVSRITSEGGQVRLGGEVWTARAYEDDAIIEEGRRVDVFEIRGATAVVHAIPEID